MFKQSLQWFAEASFALLLAAGIATAGMTEQEVKELKDPTFVPGSGHIETVYGSHMRVTLGDEWGAQAGTYVRNNRESVVWVNDGPGQWVQPVNVYPKFIHIPQPVQSLYQITSFFDVFMELNLDTGTLGPFSNDPGKINIELDSNSVPKIEGSIQGSSGAWYQGTITPFQDLNQLPTSSLYDTSIVWDLSGIQTTGGTFYLIQYDLPLYEVVPAPAAVVSGAVGLLLLGGVGGIRRRFRKCRSALH